MNDLTKEELKKILKFIDLAENSCAVCFDNDLRNKIIYVINNAEKLNNERIKGSYQKSNRDKKNQ